MTDRPGREPGLDFFWEQADLEDSGEHPLARELADRLDALQRYQVLIADADDGGRDHLVEMLLRQHAREEQEVRRLVVAMKRLSQSAK